MRRKRSGGAFFVLFVCILAVPTTACLMGFMDWDAGLQAFRPHIVTGALLGLVHLILRPILRLVTLPLGCLTFGLSGTLIDVGLIYLSAGFVRGFAVPSFLYALLTAILINAINGIVNRK